MTDYPQAIVPVNHTEPVPRRIRAVVADRVIIDTTAALYVWEWPNYPQYYVPMADIDADVLVDEQHEEHLPVAARRGDSGSVSMTITGPGWVHDYIDSAIEAITGKVRLDWAAL